MIEAPGNTAININGELVGRNLATGVLIDLAQGKGLFEDLNQPLTKKYVVWAAGYRAGPNVRFLLLQARDRFRKLAETGDLVQAIRTAYSFNVNPIPQTLEDVRLLGQGASIEQMSIIDQRAESMIDQAVRHQINLKQADYDTYRRLIDPRIYSFAPTVVVNNVVQRSMVSLVEHFLLDRQHLGLPEARTFIGDNNPSFEDLGLTDQHLGQIFNLINH